MKQKDLALFLVIGVVSAVISVMLSNMLITPSKDKQQKAEVVEPVSAVFNIPAQDSPYFNKDSNNPTQIINIGDNPNDQPFKNSN